LFDPNKKWTKEEIEEIKKEDPLYDAVHKYSFEDLLDEVPSYMENMEKKKQTVELHTCKENGEDRIQRDKTS
jgi:hypothetical protein